MTPAVAATAPTDPSLPSGSSSPSSWRPRNPRERRLWALAAAYLLLLYATAHPIGAIMRWLQERGWLSAAVTLVFIAAGLGVGTWLVRQRPGPRELSVLAGGALVYPLAASQMHILQERLHLVQYGILGGLLLAALWERRRATGAAVSGLARWPAFGALLLATLGGWGDELIQGLLPRRYYDLRDVAFNAGAAALWIALATARSAARQRDQRRT